jgi:hypothetical protein
MLPGRRRHDGHAPITALLRGNLASSRKISGGAYQVLRSDVSVRGLGGYFCFLLCRGRGRKVAGTSASRSSRTKTLEASKEGGVMSAEVCGEKKQLCVSGGKPGWFRSLVTQRSGAVIPHWTWHHCRERFHADFPKCDQFLFNISVGMRTRIVRFMWSLEKRLGLEERSQFAPTLNPEVLYVCPAKWWHKHGHMRFQFFTIALRAAMEAEPGETLLKTLRRHPYFRATWPAVRMFLDGYTKFKARKVRGWVRDLRLSRLTCKPGITLKSHAESSLSLPQQVKKYRPKKAA